MSSDHGGSADAAGSAQIARPSSTINPPPSIQTLPNELLAAVFEAGARTTFNSTRHFGTPFIIVVSHVCHHWRAVANSFADAWCYIPVYLRRDATTTLFLTRSEGHPLHVCLHLGMWPTSASVQRILELIAPSTSRWISLYILPWDATAMHPVRKYFRTLQNMARLRTFELRVDLLQDGQAEIPADFLGTPPPSLENLSCVGLWMGYQSPLLRGLTRLTLGHLPSPSPAVFHEMCAQNPRLEYLRLVDVSPLLSEDEWEGEFALNSLHTLEVVMNDYKHDEAYVPRFLHTLAAPVLQELSFQSPRWQAWQGFENAIESEDNSLFKNLRVLHLTVSKSVSSSPAVKFPRASVSPALFRAFPKLENLSLNALDHEESVLYFLRGWVAAMDHDVPSESSHKIWPQFKLLTIRVPQSVGEAADKDALKDALDLLKSLRLSNGQSFKYEVWQQPSEEERLPWDHAGN